MSDIENSIDQEMAASEAPAEAPAQAPEVEAAPSISPPQTGVPLFQEGRSQPLYGGSEVVQGIDEEMEQARHGSLPQQALTAAEGAAKGWAGPLATAAETGLSKLGVDELAPEHQIAREHANPWTHGISEFAGLGAGFMTGTGEARLLTAGGHAALEGLNIAKAVTPLAKIGSATVRAAAENMLYQSGDEISKMIQGRPADSVGMAAQHIGLSGLIGGAFGAGVEGVGALWNATKGQKVAQILNKVVTNTGGAHAATEPVEALVAKTGMDVAPEIKAQMQADPKLNAMANKLNQSNSSAGAEFQKTKAQTYEEAGEALSEALGKPIKEVPAQFDKYEAGRTIGDTLGDEFEEKAAPLKQAYEKLEEDFGDTALDRNLKDKAADVEKNIKEVQEHVNDLTGKVQNAFAEGPEAALRHSEELIQAEQLLAQMKSHAETPGTTDIISDEISNLANQERWPLSPDSDIMKGVERIKKDLPNLKTLNDLTTYIKTVGDRMQSDKYNGSLVRAGRLIKEIMRKQESEMIATHIDLKHGPVDAAVYRGIQGRWAQLANLKDQLGERIVDKGSTSAYSKTIKEMAKTDGETLWTRLSGKNDADVLNLLNQHFPKTAQAVKNAHLEQILTKAKYKSPMDAHGMTEAMHPGSILKGIQDLSPQLKKFIMDPNTEAKVKAISELTDRLKDPNYNFSNTARTLDVLNKFKLGSAIGVVTSLSGAGPLAGVITGALSHYMTHEMPDAIRLGLLKWAGSNKPVNPGAFKSMVSFIHSVAKGTERVAQSSDAFIKGAEKIIPEKLTEPNHKHLQQLDQKMKQIGRDPSSLGKASDSLSYYMPNEAMQTTASLANVANLLNQIRPEPQKHAPLDAESEPSTAKETEYYRRLAVADEPLLVLHWARQGQMTNADLAFANAAHPDFMGQLKQKLTDSLTTHLSAGKELEPEVERGLSKILGQPMISSLQPQRIMANQQVYAQVSARDAQAQAPKPSSSSKSKTARSQRVSLSPQDDS